MAKTIDGMSYSAQNYADLDMNEYRTRFPEVTKGFTDEQLWDIIAETDDDMGDAEWVKLFEASKTEA